MKFDATGQQVIWFRDQCKNGSLVLKPPFQRKPVWAAKQKCYLIESILLGVPVPEVFVQQAIIEDEAAYAVVDGQQRIRAVLQFLGIDQEEGEQEFNGLALDKLKSTSPYRDLTYGTLTPEDRERLLRYVFSVRFLDEPDDEKIRDLFVRLNRYLTKLSEQELRNATYTGPFIILATRLADDDYWIDNRLVSTAQIRRMKDVEFISDLLIGIMHGPQGGSASLIDEYYQRYEDYDDDFPNQKAATRRFGHAKATVTSIFPKLADANRWSNRTDYYSLFVAIGALELDRDLVKSKIPAVRDMLDAFGRKVDRRLADETIKAADSAVKYVRAVEKGANDKKRRADRHVVLFELLKPFFANKKKSS